MTLFCNLPGVGYWLDDQGILRHCTTCATDGDQTTTQTTTLSCRGPADQGIATCTPQTGCHLSQSSDTGGGCYEAYTPGFQCHGYAGCGYTCVGNYCGYDGAQGCLCDCHLCANYYSDKSFDPTTARCVDSDAVACATDAEWTKLECSEVEPGYEAGADGVLVGKWR